MCKILTMLLVVFEDEFQLKHPYHEIQLRCFGSLSRRHQFAGMLASTIKLDSTTQVNKDETCKNYKNKNPFTIQKCN